MRFQLPEGVRCGIALSYDLEMCAGYQPDGVNHGRIIPEVQAYTLTSAPWRRNMGLNSTSFSWGTGSSIRGIA